MVNKLQPNYDWMSPAGKKKLSEISPTFFLNEELKEVEPNYDWMSPAGRATLEKLRAKPQVMPIPEPRKTYLETKP